MGLDGRKIHRTYCRECGPSECEEFEKQPDSHKCAYCGCYPTKHARAPGDNGSKTVEELNESQSFVLLRMNDSASEVLDNQNLLTSLGIVKIEQDDSTSTPKLPSSRPVPEVVIPDSGSEAEVPSSNSVPAIQAPLRDAIATAMKDLDSMQAPMGTTVLSPTQHDRKKRKLPVVYTSSSLSSDTQFPGISRNSVPNKSLSTVNNHVKPDWAYTFRVNWNIISPDAVQSLENNDRLEPTLRRNFIRQICDQIRGICRHPVRNDIKQISKNIVDRYPSLQDLFFDEEVGCGYESLMRQIATRCENLNRTRTLHAIAARKIMQSVKPTMSIPDIRSYKHNTVRYGCTNWNPPVLLRETFESKKKEMKELFKLGPKQWEMRKICDMLRETFPLQRFDINGGTNDIPTLKMEWPFLFSHEGMNVHCFELVGIDFQELFKTCYLDRSDRIRGFLNERRTLVGTADDVYQLVCSLLDYFKENQSDVFFSVENTSIIEDIEKLKSFPNCPCVLMYGNSGKSQLSIDRTIVSNVYPVSTTIVMMMCAYFAFNIGYPKGACATLEFLQRCFLKMNPNKGSKRSKPGCHPKLLTLINDIADKEWLSSST